jgi:hypothetical protein
VDDGDGDANQAAWLVLVVSERKRRGNGGYDDDLTSRYSWDSTVPNREAVKPGDVLVMWDTKTLLGASVVERINTDTATKDVYRCRNCHGANFLPRKTMSPGYRCFACKAEFDEPIPIKKEVTTYQSEDGAAWTDLFGVLTGAQLRSLCETPRAQISMRRLEWSRFREAVRNAQPEFRLTALDSTISRVRGGHITATVRVRIGQSDFRSRLLARYETICAFTGRAPLSALEAAHLYSYAADGTHHDDGGFLLRRDWHRLFDLGLVAVRLGTNCLDLDETLLRYPGYERYHGVKVSIQLSVGQEAFLFEHWREHRDGNSECRKVG